MAFIFIFILGLIVGSFLNAVIYRLHAGESFVRGRSHCPRCRHELAAIDLVPLLSFLLLAGRCRYCRKPISLQYPLVEILSGVVFVALAWKFGFTGADFFFALAAAGFLIVIGVFDFKYFLILDKVVYPATGLGLVWSIYQDYAAQQPVFSLQSHLIMSLAGALAVSGFFALQYLISKGKWIGFGDVKLGLFLGAIAGLQLSWIVLFLAYLLGAATGIALVVFGYKKMGSRLPFGVFLSISAIITLLYGQDLAGWYLRLIGL